MFLSKLRNAESSLPNNAKNSSAHNLNQMARRKAGFLFALCLCVSVVFGTGKTLKFIVQSDFVPEERLSVAPKRISVFNDSVNNWYACGKSVCPLELKSVLNAIAPPYTQGINAGFYRFKRSNIGSRAQQILVLHNFQDALFIGYPSRGLPVVFTNQLVSDSSAVKSGNSFATLDLNSPVFCSVLRCWRIPAKDELRAERVS